MALLTADVARWINREDEYKSVFDIASKFNVTVKEARGKIATMKRSPNYNLKIKEVGGVSHFYPEPASLRFDKDLRNEMAVEKSLSWDVALFAGAKAGVMGVNGLGRV